MFEVILHYFWKTKNLKKFFMRTPNFYKVSLCLMFCFPSLHANNIATGTVTLGNQNISAPNDPANYTEIRFDLSWENAWRLSTGPANWDAAWIFAKYRIGTGDYHHAWLSPTAGDHSYDIGASSDAVTIEPATDSMGVFVHLANPGNVALLEVKDLALRWYYRSNLLDPVDDNDQVTVQVFAIEMVYVPQGSFYLGDGNQTILTTAFSTNAFRKSNSSSFTDANDAILISSEAALSFVNTTGYGAFDPAVSQNASAAYQTYTLPALFPKGFDAFYCMKYEGSVRQYVDFFNTLPNSGSARSNRNALGNTANFRHGFDWPVVNAAIDANVRSTVSGHRAMGFLSVEDVLTYLDWAALRPITELEYEKACRGHDTPHGPIYPIPREFAWGDATINTNTNISNGNGSTGGWTNAHVTNDGTTSEGINATIHNTFYANYGYATSTIANRGPLRCGIFAAKSPFPSSNPRRVAGATYYGIMEMTGNLHELCISPAVASTATTATFRRVKASNFQGVHGDGEINLTTGRFNQSNWAYPQLGYTLNTPESGGMNPVLRGGYWRTQNAATPRQQLAVSYRPPVQYPATTNTNSTAQITSNLCGMSTTGTTTLTFTTRPNATLTGNYPNWPGIRGVRNAP